METTATNFIPAVVIGYSAHGSDLMLNYIEKSLIEGDSQLVVFRTATRGGKVTMYPKQNVSVKKLKAAAKELFRDMRVKSDDGSITVCMTTIVFSSRADGTEFFRKYKGFLLDYVDVDSSWFDLADISVLLVPGDVDISIFDNHNIKYFNETSEETADIVDWSRERNDRAYTELMNYELGEYNVFNIVIRRRLLREEVLTTLGVDVHEYHKSHPDTIDAELSFIIQKDDCTTPMNNLLDMIDGHSQYDFIEMMALVE